jgi:hypothetical protein
MIKLKELMTETLLTEVGSKDFLRMLDNSGFKLGDTPNTTGELENLFRSMAANSEIIFFDYRGLTTQDPKSSSGSKYGSGIPPFMKFKKEMSNVVRGYIYIEIDNRGGDGVKFPENKIPEMAIAVHRQKNLLNKYGLKGHQTSTPNLPPGIGASQSTTIRKLDR